MTLSVSFADSSPKGGAKILRRRAPRDDMERRSVLYLSF